MTDQFTTSIFSRSAGGRRVLLCVRGNCAHPEVGEQLYRRLEELIRTHGLDDPSHPNHVNCRTVYCLGVCQGGPIMAVHPEGTRYHGLDMAALEEIFQRHLLNGEPVTTYQLTYPTPGSRD